MTKQKPSFSFVAEVAGEVVAGANLALAKLVMEPSSLRDLQVTAIPPTVRP